MPAWNRSMTLSAHIAQSMAADGGWWPFDRFMQAALYAPGLGYYSAACSTHPIFGVSPATGSDFVTAPQMSAAFGRTLAVQVAQALNAGCDAQVWEFGAGTGLLAADLLDALPQLHRYTIVDVSGGLRTAQQQRLQRFAGRVHWADELPDSLNGVVLGNEVLDAMPVKLLHRHQGAWWERGVGLAGEAAAPLFMFVDRPSPLTPPLDAPDTLPDGSVVELPVQATAFVRSLVERMTTPSLALFIDYGFPGAEFYHPQRSQGTLMCHRGHRADTDPLADVGAKDITAHVDFSAIALAAQDTGADVLGYTSQARFLLNLGLLDTLQDASLAQRSAAHRLIAEHEMGELFKAIAVGKGIRVPLRGFGHGDRTHRL
jgi:SAM-dependent MidA family methyltransferase